MLPDLRFVLRRLLTTPGFTLVAIGTLALGIGAGTAMFSILNAVLLRPLTLPQPEQLVFARELVPSISPAPLPVNAWHYQAWRERSHSFAGLGIASPRLAALNGADGAIPVALTYATAGFLPTLGLQPGLGRGFTESEEKDAAAHVVVISDRLWRARFHADPAALGQTLSLDGVPHTVVGILPPSPALDALNLAPAGYAGPDVFKPLVFAAEELADKWGRHNYAVFARLRPGVTLAAAQRELDGIGAALAREDGSTIELRSLLTPLQENLVRQSRTGLWLLLAAVFAVLLIGCVNLTGLLLARAEQRRSEIALRVALGATRARIFRLALLEPLTIAAAGGALGLLIANSTIAALPRFAPANLPRLAEVALDPDIVGFALVLAGLCGLFTGLVPAWQLAASTPGADIGQARAVAGGRRTNRRHRSFVAVQIALSFVLLAGAAVLMQSFSRLLHTDAGYRSSQVLAAQVLLPAEKYKDDAQASQFYARLLARLESTADIESAGVTNQLPLQGETWVDKIWVLGDGRAPGERPSVNIRFVSPDYFSALGLPLLGGRTFEPRDRGAEAVIISRSLARTLFGDQDPVGRRLTRDGETEATVIGVTGDVRADADRQPAPTLYRPYTDWPPYRGRLVVRGRQQTPLAATLRAALQATDPDVPLAWVRPLDTLAANAVAPQRFQTRLTAGFALAATLLTAIGLYGIVAYAVACRRKEFGVRLALGAEPASLPTTVVRHYLPAIALGLAGGALAFLGAGRVLESLLFASDPRDPLLLVGVAALLVVICMFAAWLPARRAARVDPMIALRAE